MTVPDEQTEALRQAAEEGWRNGVRTARETRWLPQWLLLRFNPYRSASSVAATAEVQVEHVHMHVSTHPDMETVARLQNEGYDTAMAQQLADDPGAAEEWLEDKLRVAAAGALSDAINMAQIAGTEGRQDVVDALHRRAVAILAGEWRVQ